MNPLEHNSWHDKINCRPALVSEGEQIAPLIYDAAPTMIDYTLGASRTAAIDFIHYCFTHNLGFYGYPHQHVALIDGCVAVTATMYEGNLFNRLVTQSILSAFKYFGLTKATGMLARSTHLSKLYAQPNKQSLFFANGCVAEPFRGQGIFSYFFNDYLLAYAEERQIRSLELDVGIENAAAKQLYTRFGFEVSGVYPYRGKADVEGIVRMVLKR